MKVEIYSPTKTIYAGDAQSLELKSADGDITVLDNHLPFFSVLEIGEVVIKSSDLGEKKPENISIVINGGVLNFTNEKAVILAKDGELSKDLVLKEIEIALEHAQKKLSAELSNEDEKHIENEIKYYTFKKILTAR